MKGIRAVLTLVCLIGFATARYHVEIVGQARNSFVVDTMEEMQSEFRRFSKRGISSYGHDYDYLYGGYTGVVNVTEIPGQTFTSSKFRNYYAFFTDVSLNTPPQGSMYAGLSGPQLGVTSDFVSSGPNIMFANGQDDGIAFLGPPIGDDYFVEITPATGAPGDDGLAVALGGAFMGGTFYLDRAEQSAGDSFTSIAFVSRDPFISSVVDNATVNWAEGFTEDFIVEASPSVDPMNVAVNVTSDDQALVLDSNIVFLPSNTSLVSDEFSLTVTPEECAEGVLTLTYTASKSLMNFYTDTMELTIINNPIEYTPIFLPSDVVPGQTVTYTFSVSDVEVTDAELTVTVTESSTSIESVTLSECDADKTNCEVVIVTSTNAAANSDATIEIEIVGPCETVTEEATISFGSEDSAGNTLHSWL